MLTRQLPIANDHADDINNIRQFQNRTIYTSDIVRIIDYGCRCNESFTSRLERSGYFSIGFTRSGKFHFRSFRQSSDVHNSRILVEKPECEYQLTHSADIGNASTFFVFSDSFYNALRKKYRSGQQGFLGNRNVLSGVLPTTPELELIHFSIWQKIHQTEVCRLEVDSMVVEFAELTAQMLSYEAGPMQIARKANKTQLLAIEKAKEYILKNFANNISIGELALHCHISPFHFSRTFKQFSAFSPYHYLQHLRLKNAEILIRTSNLSVTDICYMSGFNSLDYFSAAFSRKFKLSPSKYRLGVLK